MSGFCWHCGGELHKDAFAEVKDQIGHMHRVHKVCEPAARRSVTPLTAQELSVSWYSNSSRAPLSSDDL